jgi:8-oxo-dGTP pyrophosphatase MutT (NUDIX family)
MVRSRGRDVLYLPGGKREPGETGVAAAVREAEEEIAIRVRPDELEEFATVVETAHDQPSGTVVEMVLFRILPGGPASSATPVASAEVDQVEWIGSADAGRCPPAGVETLRLLVAADLVD